MATVEVLCMDRIWKENNICKISGSHISVAKDSNLGVLHPNEEGTTILPNARNYSPTDAMPHPRWLESSKQNSLPLLICSCDKSYRPTCYECKHTI